ncbi:preprotein translocase subunit SecE [Paraphotobacterium marinum]|uniref:Protein translocase subunit SecE n=1 Tax=Paraphotobacterium marinum TaxID=1755811 RepID=A0A220VDC7_9GAMM|nr:preprotein translocase subunit SecE [Paraphotobacterium marinum]ASK78226.1 preprotein translocase subunit SecE [Paraphotobacterium marinum]
MKASAENQKSVETFEWLKWLGVIILVVIAVVGNYIYKDTNLLYRVLAVVAILAGALLLASITNKGKNAINFAKEARMEIRKVVWPTRKETVQTSLIVIAATVFMTLVVWGVDSIYMLIHQMIL